jgi:rRNA-processing protein FCF1
LAAHRVGPGKVGAAATAGRAISSPSTAPMTAKGAAKTIVTRPARRVLFDSSFVIAILQRPTPWYDDLLEQIGGFEPVVIGPVYEELERLSKGERELSRCAGLAMELIERGVLRMDERETTERGMRRGAGADARDSTDDYERAQPASGKRRNRTRTTDDELVSRALKESALVATIDAALIRQLRASGVGVVSLRRGRVELR